MTNRTETLVLLKDLSHRQVDILEKPKATSEYGAVLQRAHDQMVNAVLSRVDTYPQNPDVFYLPKGGNIGTSRTLGHPELLSARLVTLHKPDQKVIRTEAKTTGYRLAGQQYLSLPVFKGLSSLKLVPESFVDNGTTIVGMAAQIAHEARTDGNFYENPLFIMTPTVRDIGLERIQETDEEIRMMGFAGIVIVTYKVLRGLSDDEVELMDHGKINERTVDLGHAHLAGSMRSAH